MYVVSSVVRGWCLPVRRLHLLLQSDSAVPGDRAGPWPQRGRAGHADRYRRHRVGACPGTRRQRRRPMGAAAVLWPGDADAGAVATRALAVHDAGDAAGRSDPGWRRAGDRHGQRLGRGRRLHPADTPQTRPGVRHPERQPGPRPGGWLPARRRIGQRARLAHDVADPGAGTARGTAGAGLGRTPLGRRRGAARSRRHPACGHTAPASGADDHGRADAGRRSGCDVPAAVRRSAARPGPVCGRAAAGAVRRGFGDCPDRSADA